MSETRHTDEELIKFSRHLFYEVDMLARTAGILSGPGLRELQDIDYLDCSIANGLTESWAVHVRILIEFLHKRPSDNQTDTVFIVDYISDPGLDSYCPKLETLTPMKKAYDKACQEIVHPSINRNELYEKTERGENPWKSDSITCALLTQIQTVVPRIPPERIDEAYRKKILDVRYEGPVTQVSLVRSSSCGKSGLFFADDRPPSAIGYTGTTAALPEARGWTGYRNPAATK